MSDDTFEGLWRELIDELGTSGNQAGRGPYIENDYGFVYCFFCSEDYGKPHADTCVYARALALMVNKVYPND